MGNHSKCMFVAPWEYYFLFTAQVSLCNLHHPHPSQQFPDTTHSMHIIMSRKIDTEHTMLVRAKGYKAGKKYVPCPPLQKFCIII